MLKFAKKINIGSKNVSDKSFDEPKKLTKIGISRVIPKASSKPAIDMNKSKISEDVLFSLKVSLIMSNDDLIIIYP